MADLVIGGKKAGPPRGWRAAMIALGMVLAAVIVGWFIYKRSVHYDVPPGRVSGQLTADLATTPGSPVLHFGNATLTWLGGIAVIDARGDAHELGAAQGRLLGSALEATDLAMGPSLASIVGREGWFGGATHDLKVDWRLRFLDDGMTDEDRRWVAGLARGAQASGVDVGFGELLRDQTVIDIGRASPDTAEFEQHALVRSLAIVVPQPATAGVQRLWVGRSLSLPGLADGGRAAAAPLVTFAHPDGKNAWVSVGWPGSAGVVTGVSSQGLVVMVNPARTRDVQPTRTARPIALLARSVLEEAQTLDEAVKLIQATPTLGAASFVLVDGESGKVVTVERSPVTAVTIHGVVPLVVGDILGASAFAGDPDNDRSRRVSPAPTRVTRLTKALHVPLVDLAGLVTLLHVRHGADDAPLPTGHRGAVEDPTAVQTVIIDPHLLVMWVQDPAAPTRLRGLDLRHALRGEGDRAAPPADLVFEPTTGAHDPLSVRGARGHLRTGRRALVAGHLDVAREAVARALVLCPDLPEAIELMAQIADRAGDHGGATQWWGRWLDGGADDPVVEERVRAQLGRAK